MRAASAETAPVANARMSAGAPVQPEKPTVLIERIADDVILKDRHEITAGVVVIVGFLLVWWSGWTIGCVYLVGRIVAQPSLETVVFAVPFLDAWFFVLLLLCAIFFGRICVRLGPDGLVESWTCGIWVFWNFGLFVIPHLIIGAGMFAAWLWALVSRWRRREWAFQAEAITTRLSVLGFVRTRTFDLQSLDHVELRKDVRIGDFLIHGRPPEEAEDRSFALGVVDSGGSDAFAIRELTEGEARWMERELRTAIKVRRSGRMMVPSAQGVVYDRWLDGPA